MIVAAALGLSAWVSSRQWQQTQGFQAEIKRLRGEVGELTIEAGKKDKLHAIDVPTQELMTWKWRVYVPSRGKFYITAANGVIPESREPKGARMSSSILPGERVITLALRKDNQDKWQWMIGDGPGVSTFGVSRDTEKLIEAGYFTSFSTVGGQKVVDRGADLVLLRLQMSPQAGPSASQNPTGSVPGIYLSISETPP